MRDWLARQWFKVSQCVVAYLLTSWFEKRWRLYCTRASGRGRRRMETRKDVKNLLYSRRQLNELMQHYLHRLTSCLFPVLDSQPTATELFQSLPFGSGTVFRSTSHLRRHFPSSALAWRHTFSNCVIHNTFVVSAKWHRHFGYVNRFTYLLIYLLTL